jgi:hypothetical protein
MWRALIIGTWQFCTWMYTVRKAQDVRERTLTFSKEHFQSNLNDLNNIVARESSLAGVKKSPQNVEGFNNRYLAVLHRDVHSSGSTGCAGANIDSPTLTIQIETAHIN